MQNNRKDPTTPYAFYGAKILLDGELKSGYAVIVENGVIKSILPANQLNHQNVGAFKLDDDFIISPGLIDTHIHGTHGNDVMDGNLNSLLSISMQLPKEGVTGYLATTMTTTKIEIEKTLGVIASQMSWSNKPYYEGAGLLGVHLEGPFISKDKAGAQKKEHILKPDFKLVKKWQEISNNAIKLITLAPEVEDAIEFIKQCRDNHIMASIGHTNATHQQALDAITAGATHATHMFNAMTHLHHREPGVVPALLNENKVMVELIPDDFHLHPAIIKMVYQCKGKDGIVLVTDAMRAKGLKDGKYDLGGQEVHVVNGKALLSDQKTLAGSTISMLTAIKNMVAFTECSLADALTMATANPAKILELQNSKGYIKAGYDADFVILDKNLEVKMTMRNGKPIFNNGLHLPVQLASLQTAATTSIPYKVKETADEVAKKTARIIANLINMRNELGMPTVLGLATGGTVEPLYKELVRLHKEEGLDFSNVITFNLDEYIGLGPKHPQSYSYFMHQHLFNHVNIKKENIHLFNGLVKEEDLEKHIKEFEDLIIKLGGIDIQLLGIGENGHIAFSEPSNNFTDLKATTRKVTLSDNTREVNKRYFNENESVPTHAITRGIGSIMQAHNIILLATGDKKADIIQKTLNSIVMPTIPATALKNHPNVRFILDEKAAAKLQKKSHANTSMFGAAQQNQEVAHQQMPFNQQAKLCMRGTQMM